MPSLAVEPDEPLPLRIPRFVLVSVELPEPMLLDEPVLEPELDGDVVVPMVPLPVVLLPVPIVEPVPVLLPVPVPVVLLPVPVVEPVPVVLPVPEPVVEPVLVLPVLAVPVVLDPVPVVVPVVPVVVPVLPLCDGFVTVPGVLAAGLVGLVLWAPAFKPKATKAAAAAAVKPMR